MKPILKSSSKRASNHSNSKLVLLPLFLAATVLGGCATNPVTGKSEISIISEAWELKTGKQQYAPARQSQGGDYLADEGVQAYVNEVGQKIAAVSDRSLPYEFSVINNSVPNAWALPGGKISINRGLLTELGSEAELAAVLGHEVVHSAARHGAKGVERGTILQATVAVTGIATASTDYGKYVAMGAGLGSQLINSKYGRNAELESDQYGMDYMSRAGYNPQGAVDLQQTFLQLSGQKDSSFFKGLFASHPPSASRLAANKTYAQTLPKGGVTGKARYKTVMARLNETKPAYEAYEKAKQMAKDNRPKEAKKLINQAIKVEPNEGHFRSFLGDIELDAKRYTAAQNAYAEAIKLNPGFFYPHLQSGITSEKQGALSQAKSRLNRSIELLPTSQAYNALGNIAQRQGNTEEAREYFAAASSDSGASGQAALNSLIKMDLNGNPGAYIGFRYGANEAGELQIEVSNKAPRAFKNISLSINYVDQRGKLRNSRRQLSLLSANEAKLINTGLISPQGEAQISVISATLIEG
ncbi:MAG: putative Zn-dependent protease [Candidatus Azotimanducaceae bacterium]